MAGELGSAAVIGQVFARLGQGERDPGGAENLLLFPHLNSSQSYPSLLPLSQAKALVVRMVNFTVG